MSNLQNPADTEFKTASALMHEQRGTKIICTTKEL